MNQPNFLDLAKQGNADAIAALLNRHLQPNGVTATAELRDSCLYVFLECVREPDRNALVDLIRKQMRSLEAEEIERVRVCAQKTGEPSPAWSQEFGLEVGAYSMLGYGPPGNSPESTQVEAQHKQVVKPKLYTKITLGIIAAILSIAALVFVGNKVISSSKPQAPAAPSQQR